MPRRLPASQKGPLSSALYVGPHDLSGEREGITRAGVYKEGGVTSVDTIQVLMRDEKKEERSK